MLVNIFVLYYYGIEFINSDSYALSDVQSFRLYICHIIITHKDFSIPIVNKASKFKSTSLKYKLNDNNDEVPLLSGQDFLKNLDLPSPVIHVPKKNNVMVHQATI